MKYTNIFYARHPGREKLYIFALPNLDLEVNKGDKLRVKCKSGDKTVIAAGPNWIIPCRLAQDTTKAMGGYWPLATAFGKVEAVCIDQVKPFEPNLNPAEYDLFDPLPY